MLMHSTPPRPPSPHPPSPHSTPRSKYKSKCYLVNNVSVGRKGAHQSHHHNHHLHHTAISVECTCCLHKRSHCWCSCPNKFYHHWPNDSYPDTHSCSSLLASTDTGQSKRRSHKDWEEEADVWDELPRIGGYINV